MCSLGKETVPVFLRSSEDKQLVVIKTRTHYGDISFQVAAAKLWNAAPFNSKVYKILTVSRVN